jgi:hypothetical protein
MGGRAELEAFTSGIEVNVVEQVKPVKMPTANVAMLAQYFLKSGAQLSTQVPGVTEEPQTCCVGVRACGRDVSLRARSRAKSERCSGTRLMCLRARIITACRRH